MQASGTPHFFVNGRRLVGAQPVEKFAEIIDDELPKTAALLAKGIPADKLYDAVIKEGKGAPEVEKKVMVGAAERTVARQPEREGDHRRVLGLPVPVLQALRRTRVNEVMKTYGDRIKFVWRNMPLPMHPDAPLAAQASMEAFKQKGSDGFWKMHDLLYANQPSGQKQDGLKREALDTTRSSSAST